MPSQNLGNPAVETLTVQARMESLVALQDFAASRAEKAGVPPALMLRIELVLEELLVNVFHYAYPKDQPGDVTLTCALEGDKLVFSIRDTGGAFNPLDKETVDTSLDIDERSVGGLGIYLVREMVHSLEYMRDSGQNILRFSFPTAE